MQTHPIVGTVLERNLSKIIGLGRLGRGGLKIFARKGGGGVGKAKWRGGFVPKGGCHIILRFFLRFLVMQHRKTKS